MIEPCELLTLKCYDLDAEAIIERSKATAGSQSGLIFSSLPSESCEFG